MFFLVFFSVIWTTESGLFLVFPKVSGSFLAIRIEIVQKNNVFDGSVFLLQTLLQISTLC